jgi:hypothetical protein
MRGKSTEYLTTLNKRQSSEAELVLRRRFLSSVEGDDDSLELSFRRDLDFLLSLLLLDFLLDERFRRFRRSSSDDDVDEEEENDEELALLSESAAATFLNHSRISSVSPPSSIEVKKLIANAVRFRGLVGNNPLKAEAGESLCFRRSIPIRCRRRWKRILRKMRDAEVVVASSKMTFSNTRSQEMHSE